MLSNVHEKLLGAGLAAAASLGVWAQGPIPVLKGEEVEAARKAMRGIEVDPRGPYGPIQWYCKDGRVLPPQGAPCGPKGGFQHAAPSILADQMARMNFDIARLLAGMPFEQFVDEKRNHFWLREMVMLDYLVGRNKGWIYAKTYARRGVRQVEDEEKEGRRLLQELLSRPEWVERHYLLTMLAGSVTPHGVETGRLKEIRTLSAALADQDPRFQALRGKLHSKPEPGDVEAVAAFVKDRKPADGAGFAKLLGLMQAEYGGRAASTQGFSLERAAERSLELRRLLGTSGGTGRERLGYLDEQLRLQEQAFLYGANAGGVVTRRERLREVVSWVKLATGAGLLSLRQLKAIEEEAGRLQGQGEVKAEEYRERTGYIESAAEWARAAVMRETLEVQTHYAAVNEHANGLADDILRRSVTLALANRVETLTREADELSGRQHRLFDQPGRRGVRALNAGVAVGRLEVIERPEEVDRIEPDRIYVIPGTAADLKPMRGIITLDSGNALSHAQLLAANLGIPNATLPSSLLPELRAQAGKDVFYAVTPGGTVVMRRWDAMPAGEQAFWQKSSGERRRVVLDTSRVNLGDRALKTLEETGSEDSGVRSGPKAANLGQLKRLFPANVAPGVVVPFGVYYAHISRKESNGRSLADDIGVAFREAERMRNANEPAEKIRMYIYPKLADFRKRIRGIALDPAFERELTGKMAQVFGADGSYGVFVRSDTNVEDLPQFTGAGLNLTVPNVVGTGKILQALRDVWASPFEERAYAWRSQALESTEKVYPSVVLLKTVAADKSGVMATANLATLNTNDITVNVNEGPAAVVDGGVAESLLLSADGGVKFLAQARAAYRRRPAIKGGFDVIPTSGSDYVLTQDEIGALRRLAADVKAKMRVERDASGVALPWDIEFGFEGGQLRLFQIRPLVRYREARTLEALSRLEGGGGAVSNVRLDERMRVQ